MNSLRTVFDAELAEILPPSISDDEQMQSVAAGLDHELQDVATDLSSCMPLLPNLSKVPERVVDLLAWQYHVDNYDPAADISFKRTRVRNAIAEHRIQGTKQAVVNVLDLLFGRPNYTIEEWFEYGGDPFHFKVQVITADTLSESFTSQMNAMLATAKNVRSWYQLTIVTPIVTELALHFAVVSNRMIYRRAVVTSGG